MTVDQEKEKRDQLADKILIQLIQNMKVRHHLTDNRLIFATHNNDTIVHAADLAELAYKMAETMIARSKS